MSPDPETKSNVRVTVTATAVIINLVVILILDEIYGNVAVWLTELGTGMLTVVQLQSVALKSQSNADATSSTTASLALSGYENNFILSGCGHNLHLAHTNCLSLLLLFMLS